MDEDLKDGPVHVIKNNKPQYVVMDEESYEELVSESEASYETRLQKRWKRLKKESCQPTVPWTISWQP